MGGLAPAAESAVPTLAEFFRQTLSAALADSMATRLFAPRDSASRPSAPVPANKSSTSAFSIAPTASKDAKTLSLTRSEVGLVPAGADASLIEPAKPLIILLTR